MNSGIFGFLFLRNMHPPASVLPVRAGRDLVACPELTDEVGEVVESALAGDLAHGILRLTEEVAGRLQTVVDQIPGEGLTALAPEDPHEIGLAVSRAGGDVGDGQLFAVVKVHLGESRLHEAGDRLMRVRADSGR